MTYTDLVTRLAAAMGDDHSTDSDFGNYLPAVIEQAELRCYRDLDLLSVRKTATTSFSNATQSYALPSDWLLGQGVRLTTQNAALDRRDYSFLMEYGGSGQPKYWAEQPQGTLWLAPTPDNSYAAELSYHFRPAALSASNASTYLTLLLPDLFFYACMVAVTGYLKNFGAQADDPRQAMSWEQQYQVALATARREEARRKGDNSFDSSAAPSPGSNLPQGVQG